MVGWFATVFVSRCSEIGKVSVYGSSIFRIHRFEPTIRTRGNGGQTLWVVYCKYTKGDFGDHWGGIPS